MAKQVVGLFDNTQDAQGAVQALRNAGFTADDISIVANNARGDVATGDGGDGGSEAAEGAGAGATGGAVLGGLGGLLVGLGALAIPGIGPVVAAGTLATTLGTTLAGAGLGAAAGGLVGALVGAGIPEEDAGVYAEGVRRGGALVTVQAGTDDDADRAADILDQYGVVDIDERSENYRSGGWNGFDENAGPYDTAGTGASTGRSGGDAAQSEWQESSKAGTAGGGLAGAATGAAVGSAGGPVGTVIGGVAGAVTGAGVGAAGDTAGEAARDRSQGEDDFGSGGTRGSMGGSGDYSATSGTGSGAAIGSATDYGTSGRDVGTSDYGTTGATGSGAAMGSTTDYGTSGRDVGTSDVGTTGGMGTGAAMGSATDYGTSGRDVRTSDYDTSGRDVGTTGTTGGAFASDTTSGSFGSGTRDVGTDQGEVSIPIVEEQIRVGTREVESGGVRVDTRVEETPVREQVNLRDEQVRVERRPVDQQVDASTVTDAFREGTFEVRERDQEAVVQKDARVVEEVVINKDVQQRTETVEDTVRRTDVDVQEMSGDTRSTGYTGTTGTTSGYTDASGTTGENEGRIESTLGDAKAGFERRTGLDVDNSGEAGDRDRRNNF